MVTGGAGYIGAHVVRAFVAKGIDVVVVDNMSTGRFRFVPNDVPIVEGDLNDTALLARTIERHDVTGVMHIGGYKYAGESVKHPLQCYRDNVSGTMSLLEAMAGGGVDRIVFSSSASVYGTPDTETVTEGSPLHPESPYGESKLIGEWLLRDQARATGLRAVCLRYFNVVGSGTDEVWDVSPHNLLPKVFEAVLAGSTPTINGGDYPTPDGTNVRDYVHVADLAHSHVVAAEALDAGRELAPVYNLGSGAGSSNKEIMAAISKATTGFTPEIGPRRPGDPARIVADGTLAARDLEWEMRHTIDEMVASAWSARQAAKG